MEDKHVIAAGKSVCTLRGVLGPGKPVEKKDIKVPENFEKLIEKKIIVAEKDYTDNDDSMFRAPEKKEEKAPEKKEEKAFGAKKGK